MNDLTIPYASGIVNIRAGAIIANDNKVLMATNAKVDYLYSIGGRVKFGESAESAIVREIYEELGISLEIDRLGIVHENFFFKEYDKDKKLIYEISFYYYMKKFEKDNYIFKATPRENGIQESYEWVDSNDSRKMYPVFMYEYAVRPRNGIVHIYTDERHNVK